jgi:glycosyltransferase involved in cell wall biosynthesis
MNKQQLPLVSICIPTYNSSSTIKQTLNSIINQSYKNLEIIICDNASEDKTLDIIKTIKDPRIIVYENKTNIGGEGNFSLCIKYATGQYTAIFHADDVYKTKMVEKQIALFESNNSLGAVFTESITINENGDFTGRRKTPKNLDKKNNIITLNFDALFKQTLLNHNFLTCPSAMLRSTIYKKEIVRYRSDLFKSSSDLDVWFRVAKKYTIAIICEPLMQYRISPNQYTSGIVRKRIKQADFFLVIDHYLNDNKVKKILLNEDYRHIGWLKRSDRVIRAMNFYIIGDRNETRNLINGIFTWDAIVSAITTKKGVMTLFLGVFIKVSLLLYIDKISRIILLKGRTMMN